LPEGAHALITLLSEEENDFWLRASETLWTRHGTMPRTMFMPDNSKSEIVPASYPFSDLFGLKVRPAVVVNAPHLSKDLLLTPLRGVEKVKWVCFPQE